MTPSPPAPDGCVSVREAMDQLNVSRQRAYTMINTGTLASVRRGGRIWVPQASINQKLRERKMLADGQYVRTAEVARFFGVEVRAVHEWVQRGFLHPSKVAGRLQFDQKEIVKFIPPSTANTGRRPGHKGVRVLRGRHYPLPPGWDRKEKKSE